MCRGLLQVDARALLIERPSPRAILLLRKNYRNETSIARGAGHNQ